MLGVVRTLIAYGRDLADALNQHASVPHLPPYFRFVATIFGSRDVALILARVTRGLLRAAALEDRLRRRPARGRDIQPRSVRSPRKPRATKPTTSPRGPDPDPHSPPTLEQIATEDRCRPIGAILVDICLDLGIVPSQMDRATREELRCAVIDYRGSLCTLYVTRLPDDDPTAIPDDLPIPFDKDGNPIITHPPWHGRRPPHSPPLEGGSMPRSGSGGRGPGP